MNFRKIFKGDDAIESVLEKLKKLEAVREFVELEHSKAAIVGKKLKAKDSGDGDAAVEADAGLRDAKIREAACKVKGMAAVRDAVEPLRGSMADIKSDAAAEKRRVAIEGAKHIELGLRMLEAARYGEVVGRIREAWSPAWDRDGVIAQPQHAHLLAPARELAEDHLKKNPIPDLEGRAQLLRELEAVLAGGDGFSLWASFVGRAMLAEVTPEAMRQRREMARRAALI